VNELDLSKRSIRTWAWIGDAEFEREVRLRVASRGDFPIDRLDAIKARVVRAEAQAALLAEIQAQLDGDELAVVRRARNARVSGSGRARRNVRDYRAATGLEALVAFWTLGEHTGRLEEVLGPALDGAIDRAVARYRARPRRG
jgi:ribonuclease-3 family protein